jgi:hypothetical protein
LVQPAPVAPGKFEKLERQIREAVANVRYWLTAELTVGSLPTEVV